MDSDFFELLRLFSVVDVVVFGDEVVALFGEELSTLEGL